MIYYTIVLSVAVVAVVAIVAYVYIANRRINTTSEMILSLSLCITSYINLQNRRVQLDLREINV